MSTTRELPKDLAGWQCVEYGAILDGDLFVLHGQPLYFAKESVGRDATAAKCEGFHIYRKIPVAKQGDSDPSWQGELGRLNAACGKHGLPPLDLQERVYLKEVFDAGRNKAATYDDGKPPLANLPWAGVREVAMVQAYGHSKYKDFNNFRKGMEVSRNLSCAIRHISEYMDGNDLDSESGRNHLAHAACRLLFVLQNLHDKTAIDDRYKPTQK